MKIITRNRPNINTRSGVQGVSWISAKRMWRAEEEKKDQIETVLAESQKIWGDAAKDKRTVEEICLEETGMDLRWIAYEEVTD